MSDRRGRRPEGGKSQASSGQRRSGAEPVRERTRKRSPDRSSEEKTERGGDAKTQPARGGGGKQSSQKKQRARGRGGDQSDRRKQQGRGGGAGRGRGRSGNRSQGGRGGGRSRGRGGEVRAFWGDASALPAASNDVRITDDPHAVPRSLGEPPLPQQREIAEHYFAAIYDRAVMAAGALAAAGGLIGLDELRDARSRPDTSD
ncbi:MAG: hypothetical protein KY469_09540 [Actinobacteria bacterium]|nr:hypothetical protein [Actinomycetota bacterium]